MKYVCISCGNNSDKLYHEYKGGIIKITICEECGCVVDKYIEYDLVIVSLDALLLKRQAFRHILINSGIKSHWKFLLVLLICEAVTKLLGDTDYSDSRHWKSENVIYTALELDLYWNFVSAALEMLCFIFGVLLCVTVIRLFSASSEFPSLQDIINGLVLSSLGRILILPAMLWGLNYSIIYTRLCDLFTVAANVQAVRVLLPRWNTACIIVCIVCGHLLANLMNTGLKIMKNGII